MMNKNDHHDTPEISLSNYQETYIKMSRNRSIFFYENVSTKTAAELSALLIYYDHMDHEEPIYLYLHSNGGDANGLSNIYDVMQMIRAPVKTILLGKCYSAGAFLLAAGTPGERYALPSSKIMIHGVQFVFPLPGGDTVENDSYYKFVNQNNDKLMKILAKHTGQTLEKIKQDCQRELWMTAYQAVEYGLVDNVIESLEYDE